MGYKINKQIGAKIRRLRKSKKITQEELASKIRVQPATISNIELGHTDTSVYTLYKISQVLKVHTGDLFRFR